MRWAQSLFKDGQLLHTLPYLVARRAIIDGLTAGTSWAWTAFAYPPMVGSGYTGHDFTEIFGPTVLTSTLYTRPL